MRSVRYDWHWMIGFRSSRLEIDRDIRKALPLSITHTLPTVCFPVVWFIWLRCSFLGGMFRDFDESFGPRRSFLKMVPFLSGPLLDFMARILVVCFFGPLEFDITWMSTSKSSSEDIESWSPVLSTTVWSISPRVSICPSEYPFLDMSTSACPITFLAAEDREGRSMGCASWCSSLASRQKLRSFHLSRYAVKTESTRLTKIQKGSTEHVHFAKRARDLLDVASGNLKSRHFQKPTDPTDLSP